MKPRPFDPELYPKFRTKAGLLTGYAFGCGYVENYERDDDRLTLSREPNDWHVKGFIGGRHVWEIFERLTDARQFCRRHTAPSRTLEARLALMLAPYFPTTDARADVIAAELWRDESGGWSVNQPFRIARDADLAETLDALRSRWEVFKANYHPRARVQDITNASFEGVQFPALLEIDGIHFAEIRPARP